MTEHRQISETERTQAVAKAIAKYGEKTVSLLQEHLLKRHFVTSHTGNLFYELYGEHAGALANGETTQDVIEEDTRKRVLPVALPWDRPDE